MNDQMEDHSRDDWWNLNKIIRLEINLSKIIKIKNNILFIEIIAPIEEIKFQQ